MHPFEIEEHGWGEFEVVIVVRILQQQSLPICCVAIYLRWLLIFTSQTFISLDWRIALKPVEISSTTNHAAQRVLLNTIKDCYFGKCQMF